MSDRSWMPKLNPHPMSRAAHARASKWPIGTYDSPLSVETFTVRGMIMSDATAWKHNGKQLGHLIQLAEEYGQVFQWHDGKVYPKEHRVQRRDRLLLLCKPTNYSFERRGEA